MNGNKSVDSLKLGWTQKRDHISYIKNTNNTKTKNVFGPVLDQTLTIVIKQLQNAVFIVHSVVRRTSDMRCEYLQDFRINK